MDNALLDDLPQAIRATAQQVGFIDQKIRMLEARRDEAEDQLYMALERERKRAALDEYRMAGIYGSLRVIFGRAIARRWDMHIPLVSSRMAGILTLGVDRHRLNGPRGESWVGNFPLDWREPAPRDGLSVVYVLYDDTNEPVYVGSSEKFRQRLKAHVKAGKVLTAWMAAPCADRAHAYQVEERLLKERLPPLNKRASR
jgi:hypothetical protein